MTRFSKLLYAALILALAVPAGAPAFAAPQSYELDPVHSFFLFRVKHLGVAYTHGRFTDVTGRVVFDPEEESNNAVSIEIQTASVNTDNERRDAHLRTADFFDVETHPAMRFVSDSWEKTGDNTYRVTGGFTLHGVTREITVDVVHTGAGTNQRGRALIGFEGSFTINRSDYGMTGLIGPVGDEVTITFSVEAGAADGEHAA